MLGLERLSVVRKTGAWVNGMWVDDTSTNIEIYASVQPLSSNEMQSLPEGRRNSLGYCLYVPQGEIELTTAEVDEKNPDIVIIDGVNYEVVKRMQWRKILPHNVYIVLMADQK